MTSMKAYYSEHDPFAAAWLRNLIADGLIAAGDVDERDIQEVQPHEIAEYTQVHLFAGIGGWSYALRLAGWPDDRPVWTGSCPCQPFSSAGKRQGEADARHLWPEMRRLISERHPAICFGEQVASDDGCQWLAGVFADLEELEYRVAGADLCAAGVSAPHTRQRLFWVGDTEGGGCPELRDAARPRGGRHALRPSRPGPGGLVHANGERGRSRIAGREHATDAWQPSEVVGCRDGKRRRIEPGARPLVDGFPGRVDQLRGFGNAINPYVAARFIEASMTAIEGNP